MRLFKQDQVEMKTNQSFVWYLSTFMLLLLIPIRTLALYYTDILSDIAQTFTLFNNCHADYGAYSIAIIGTSYISVAFYTKFVDGENWSKSFKYPFITG